MAADETADVPAAGQPKLAQLAKLDAAYTTAVGLGTAIGDLRQTELPAASKLPSEGGSVLEVEAALRHLGTMKTSELKKRARMMGVPEVALDDADDAADPKATVIKLVVARDRDALQRDPRSPYVYDDGGTA